MTDALKELIARDEWLEVAKAITFAYVNAPKNPAKYAWISAVEEGPYHIETNDSAANGGQGFKAICGVAGDFNFHLTAAQIFPSQKCKTCVELSERVSDSSLKFAVDGQTPVLSAGQVTIPSQGCRTLSTSGSIAGLAATVSQVADMATGNAPDTDSPMVGIGGEVPAKTSPLPYDFTDNILRYMEGIGR